MKTLVILCILNLIIACVSVFIHWKVEAQLGILNEAAKQLEEMPPRTLYKLEEHNRPR